MIVMIAMTNMVVEVPNTHNSKPNPGVNSQPRACPHKRVLLQRSLVKTPTPNTVVIRTT
jgi:hypothetical protein